MLQTAFALACALWSGCPVKRSPWNASKGYCIDIRTCGQQLLAGLTGLAGLEPRVPPKKNMCKTGCFGGPMQLNMCNLDQFGPFLDYWSAEEAAHSPLHSSTTAAWPCKAAQCSGSASCLSLMPRAEVESMLHRICLSRIFDTSILSMQ